MIRTGSNKKKGNATHPLKGTLSGLGDSIMNGYLLTNPSTENYFYKTALALNMYEINGAITASTLATQGGSNPGVSRYTNYVVTTSPDKKYVVAMGTNDVFNGTATSLQFAAALDTVVDGLISTYGYDPKNIILCTLLWRGQYIGANAIRLDDFNDIIIAKAASAGTKICDWFNYFYERADLFIPLVTDVDYPLHPNSTGADLLKDILVAVINGATLPNYTPVAPTLNANDTANTLSAAHWLGTGEIEVNENSGGWTAYSGEISVGDVTRTAGYWQFRVKSASGRNVSPTADSPSFSDSSSDADATAFFTASGLSDTTQRNAITQLVIDLKSAGIWTKMKAIYPFVGGTASLHRWNLKDARDLDAAYRLSFINSPTHSSNGVDWNGTDQYATTFINHSTVLSVNSAHYSYYSREDTPGSSVNEMGAFTSGAEVGLALKESDGNYYPFNTNQTSYPAVANSDSRGFYIVNRNTTNTEGYKNGVRVVNNTQTGGSPNAIIYLGCHNVSGPTKFTTKQCAFASIGDALTETEAASFYTAVQAFQTTLGRSV